MAKHSLLTITAMLCMQTPESAPRGKEFKDSTVSKQEFMNSFLQILDQVCRSKRLLHTHT